MPQTKNFSLRITDEDRAAVAEAKVILEKEHKGLKFSMIAVLRTALYFFLAAKKPPTPKK